MMIQRQRHALVYVLWICLSLWNFGCLAQDDTLATEGSCNVDYPNTCETEAGSMESDLNDNDVEERDNDGVEDIDCQDEQNECFGWAERGECDNNPEYMLSNCSRSCKQCPDQAEELAKILEEIQKMKKVWTTDELEVAADMGEEQVLENKAFGVSVEDSLARITAAREHIQTTNLDRGLMNICKNQHAECTTWAVAGECKNNKKYMVTSCAPACMTCDKLLIENRCPIDPYAKPAWKPGSLNAMFEYLISEPVASKYPVTILSKDPWVVTLDDVVSEEEALHLIELGSLKGYKRSEDVGAKKADGSYGSIVSTGRTSTNAWCTSECYKDATALKVTDRLSELTMINEKNSEHLQLLRYEPGQFYEDHHDYIGHNIENQQGVRILTSYLYLNDVEAGGGTRFTDLNITVMPKRGRALFWPSVLNDSPHEKDRRTNHQALPVEAGIKFGANGWYHQFDFKTPFEEGCTG